MKRCAPDWVIVVGIIACSGAWFAVGCNLGEQFREPIREAVVAGVDRAADRIGSFAPPAAVPASAEPWWFPFAASAGTMLLYMLARRVPLLARIMGAIKGTNGKAKP